MVKSKIKRKLKKPSGATMVANNLLDESEQALAQFDYEKACNLMAAALERTPNDHELMDRLGEVLITYLGEEERGREILERSISLAPQQGYTKYMTLGQLIGGSEGLTYYKQGAEIIAHSIQTESDPAVKSELHLALSQAFCAVAELWMTDLCMEDVAEAQCKAALDFSQQYGPNNVEVYILLAQHHINAQQPAECNQNLTKALQLISLLEEERQPGSGIIIELGKILMIVNRWDEGYHVLKSTLLEDDSNGYVWYLMGTCLHNMGKHRRSLRHLLKAKGIASRVHGSADEQGDDGPAQFLAGVDQVINEVASKVGSEANAVANQVSSGEGWVTDSEDEQTPADSAMGMVKAALSVN
eukprot:TRINITY_DN12703_c0_g2_i1.p1 TRINITY_DN12703_c0_g2~~TRINITY_DN12703_c0_g2_i1.p1  ORF type:complete len:357 (+),score=66.12 TRINITY_DN12703_c0_g2_i1:70-1140(+)